MSPQKEQTEFITSLAHLADKTKSRYHNYLGLYLNWIITENIKDKEVRTVDVLAFINTLKEDYSPEQHHRIIHTIRTWYTYKNYQRNPALGINIRYQTSKVPHGLLDRENLHNIYYKYQSTTKKTYRNKIIIGLLIFQGLTSGEIKRLQTQDIKLAEGKIYIRSSRHTNSRTLRLEACQILEMKTYQEDIRPELKHTSTNQLIISKKSMQVQNILNHLFIDLREHHPEVKHARQIRQSVLSEWLKEKDVRIVQYMSGHKSVKSTEYYQSLHLKDLQEQLNKFHPLG